MKFIGALLVLAALGALAFFAWPLLKPEAVQGARPQTFSSERSQGISSGPAAAPATPAATASSSPTIEETKAAAAAAAASPEAAAGPLCDSRFDAASARGLALPTGRWIKRFAPTGKATASAWTWISLWAAWCKPCKEEMPILSAWATRLRGQGKGMKVLFLSVDDDERQLNRFMSAQGAALAGDFLWVEDEAARTRFYQSIGVSNPPTLPVQVLLDPSGKVRCVRVGSIGSRELDQAVREFGI